MRFSILLILCLMVMACGTTSTPSRFYTLSSQVDDSGQRYADLSIGLSQVELGDRLRRPELLVRETENRVRREDFHRWAGALEEEIALVLARNLQRLTGSGQVQVSPWVSANQPDHEIRLKVLELSGSPGHEVTARFQWSIRSGEVTRVYTRDYREQAGAGMEAVVQAKSRILGYLARDMVSQITEP